MPRDHTFLKPFPVPRHPHYPLERTPHPNQSSTKYHPRHSSMTTGGLEAVGTRNAIHFEEQGSPALPLSPFRSVSFPEQRGLHLHIHNCSARAEAERRTFLFFFCTPATSAGVAMALAMQSPLQLDALSNGFIGVALNTPRPASSQVTSSHIFPHPSQSIVSSSPLHANGLKFTALRVITGRFLVRILRFPGGFVKDVVLSSQCSGVGFQVSTKPCTTIRMAVSVSINL